MTVAELTPAEERALDWLRRVGNASRKALKGAGFRERTFERLVGKGQIKCRYVGVRSAPIYYLDDES